jgi:hypothetical protein
MDGIGAAAEAALKWITDDRKLRAALLAFVLFGLIVVGLKDRHSAMGVPHEWIIAVYTVSLLATLGLTAAALDVLACKAYSNHKAYQLSECQRHCESDPGWSISAIWT